MNKSGQVKKANIIKPHNTNMDKYYEYRIYDKNIGDRNYSAGISDFAPCPIVFMSRHQGFQWNDELFVSAYRRKAGYECHKSASLKNRDDHILSTVQGSQQLEQSSVDTNLVFDIKLTEADCDVWP